jgi:hypothetical protein
MPFDDKDPRASLAAGSSSKAKTPGQYHGTKYVRFYDMEPSEQKNGVKSWYGRGQNMVLEYTEAEAGGELLREGQPDEYVILLPDAEASLKVTTDDETKTIPGYSISVIPPGNSRIEAIGPCRFVRLFSIRSEDLAAKCANAEDYATADVNVAPFEPWPDPPEGFKVRTYSLEVPEEDGRFGRIWRCSTFMVNYFMPTGPRPLDQMSPHAHDDFEQLSLFLGGEYQHHVRWPWVTDMNQWLDDEHETVKSPSMIVTAPPSIHTTNGLAKENNQLIDIFCPPRIDFSEKEGWVLNSEDYPMP